MQYCVLYRDTDVLKLLKLDARTVCRQSFCQARPRAPGFTPPPRVGPVDWKRLRPPIYPSRHLMSDIYFIFS